MTNAQKDIQVVREWLDGGCPSWGVPVDQIRKLCSAHAALELLETGEHTPGPWVFRKATASVPTTHVYSPTGHIASTMGKNHEANARLIAAAPEMYEALKLVMQHGRIDDSEHRMNVVSAALAKAGARHD